MRVPYSWLREVVKVGAPGWDVTPDELEQALVRIGPIPKGTPINLLANLEPNLKQLVVLKLKIAKALAAIKLLNLSPEDSTAELIKLVPELLAANKCPDFVEDKGHYFGADLPDSDKLALIEFLKTM